MPRQPLIFSEQKAQDCFYVTLFGYGILGSVLLCCGLINTASGAIAGSIGYMFLPDVLNKEPDNLTYMQIIKAMSTGTVAGEIIKHYLPITINVPINAGADQFWPNLGFNMLNGACEGLLGGFALMQDDLQKQLPKAIFIGIIGRGIIFAIYNKQAIPKALHQARCRFLQT